MNDLMRKMSQEKFVELRVAFDLFDTDNDGKIDLAELGKAIEKMGGQKLSMEDLREIVKEVDSDYNGTVEFDEFIALMESKMKDVDSEEELYEVFKIFDKNGNGKVSKNDIRIVLNGLREIITPQELQDLMDKYDIDKDGYLNYEEFKDMMLLKY